MIKKHGAIEPGRKFGRLTVVDKFRPSEGTEVLIRCRCECGGEKIAYPHNLTRGLTKSCGCLSREMTGARSRTHGESESTEFKTWCGIKRRCFNKNEQNYPRYGGRGITMCDRWRDSFEAFLADVGRKPTPGHSIDRIDVNGNYEPGNCRWATLSEQRLNRRDTIRAA